MGKYESVVQSAVEKLLEDECLRGNLTDDEANLLFKWAVEWLESRVDQAHDVSAARATAQAEVARLRSAISKINALLIAGKTPTAADVAQALGLLTLKTTAQRVLDRKSLIQILTFQLAEEWIKR